MTHFVVWVIAFAVAYAIIRTILVGIYRRHHHE